MADSVVRLARLDSWTEEAERALNHLIDAQEAQGYRLCRVVPFTRPDAVILHFRRSCDCGVRGVW